MVQGRCRQIAGVVWVHQVLFFDLMTLGFISLTALSDPKGLVKNMLSGTGGGSEADVSKLHVDLARSNGPAAFALAFLCTRSFWRSMKEKGDALIVLTVFHAANLFVLVTQFWEQGSTDMKINETSSSPSPSPASEQVRRMNFYFGMCVLLAHASAVAVSKLKYEGPNAVAKKN